MKGKKLLSLVLTLCMLLQVVGIVPAMADDAVVEETPVRALGVNTIINDQFDTDLGNWKLGALREAEGREVTFDRVTLEDGTTALKLTTSANAAESDGEQPNVINVFDRPVEFADDAKIVIKTRVMQKGAGGVLEGEARSFLKYNRPDTTDYKALGALKASHEVGQNWYMLAEVTQDKVNYSQYNTYGSEIPNVTPSFGNWTELEIVIDGTKDGNNKDYTITATANGTTNTITTGNLDETENAYNVAGVTDTNTGFTSLDSLTFTMRKFAGELYVDYS